MPRSVPSLPAEPPSGDSDSANVWEVVNLNSLLRSLAPILRQVAGNKVALELRLASDLGQTRITPPQFQPALLKLCAQAKKIMPEGRKDYYLDRQLYGGKRGRSSCCAQAGREQG